MSEVKLRRIMVRVPPEQYDQWWSAYLNSTAKSFNEWSIRMITAGVRATSTQVEYKGEKR